MNYLFISPHVDDCVLSCGATMAKLSEKSSDNNYEQNYITHLTLSQMYDGVILSDEFHNSNRHLNCKGIVRNYTTRNFYTNYDGILQELYKHEKDGYDFIFAPSSKDFHIDHETVGKASERVFKKSNLITYQADWNTRNRQTNYFYRVEQSHVEQKIKALACYESQKHRTYMNPDYIWANVLNTGIMAGCKYSEGFQIVNLIQ